MRKSLIFLCILAMAFSLFTVTAQEDFSRIGLRSRTGGLQAVYNYLQSQGQASSVKLWLKFDEASGDLIDQTANNNDLTAAGTPTYQQPDYLGLGRAIAFNGTTDYFSITDAAQTGLDLGTKDIVFLVLAKPTTDVTTNRYLLSKYEGATKSYYLTLVQTTGKVQLGLEDGANELQWKSDNAHNVASWQLFEAKVDRDSATGVDLYVNGASDLAVKGDPTSLGNLDNTADFKVAGLFQYFQGSIAEVMVITGSPLDILTDEFALFAYNQALGYPLSLPKKIKGTIN